LGIKRRDFPAMRVNDDRKCVDGQFPRKHSVREGEKKMRCLVNQGGEFVRVTPKAGRRQRNWGEQASVVK